MSVETTSLSDLGRQLGEAIANSPQYESFEEARSAVENSPEVQEKINEFEQIRQEFMLARQTNQATREDLEKVRAAQDELHSLPVMDAYLRAQGDLVGILESVNDAISEPLAVDFSDQAGGCCHD